MKGTEFSYFCGGLQGPPLHTLDNIALKRKLEDLRSKLAKAEARRRMLEHDSHFWRAQLEQVRRIAEECEANAAQTITDLELRFQAAQRHARDALAKAEQAGEEAIVARIERDQALQARDTIQSSTSWRVTRPLRAIGNRLPSELRRLLGKMAE
jgi:HD-GYP domain-containing protein (c-di-GMP phosphodiesterase class II)